MVNRNAFVNNFLLYCIKKNQGLLRFKITNAIIHRHINDAYNNDI